MYLNSRNISLFTALIFGVAVTGVKIKSGVTSTTTHSPNSLQPKFTPSQQIVTDLLTPQFAKASGQIRTKGSGRKTKKGKQHVGVVVGAQTPGDGTTSYSTSSSTTAWDLEHPLVPGDSWNMNQNLSRGPIGNNASPSQEISSARPNSFTFSTPSLVDSTWVGMSKRGR